MTDAPTTPDPIEIAMEAEASGRAPEGVAHEVLRRQSQLFRWQIASERAGFALKVLTGLAGLAVAGALAAMAWSAAQDRSVVIEPLRAPADLAREGADGPALANALQDKLAALEAETRPGGYASAELRNRAPTEVRVQIPATGVSITDLDQALTLWLGHQTHVTGELARLTTGPRAGALALNIRVGGQPGLRLVQPDGDLDALLARATEHVFAGVDPLRYGSWLFTRGRFAELDTHYRRVAFGPWPADVRAEAFGNLGGAPGVRDRPDVQRKYLLEAVRLSNGRSGVNDLGVLENSLGHSEAALGYWRQALRSYDGRRRLESDERRTTRRLTTEGNIAAATADYGKSFGITCYPLRIAPCRGEAVVSAVLARPALLNDAEINYRVATSSRIVAIQHQPSVALRIIALGRAAVGAAQNVPLAARLGRDADWLNAQLEAHRQAQDWPGLLAAYRELEASAAQRGVAPAISQRAYLPLALAHLGDGPAARTAAAALPGDCMRCVWHRALIADLAGDPRGADALFADVVRQAPSLPLAEADWARSWLARGDRAAAQAHAAHAHKAAPRWADPLEIWGEALAAQGDAKGATRKYEAAEPFAPRWGRLHLKWGDALAKLGKADEARAKWRAAATMDLTADERAALKAHGV